MLIINEILFAFELAVFAYVFTCVLTVEKYCFEWYYDLLVDLEVVTWRGYTVGRWLAYPLGLCEKCFGGQVALWVWLYFNNGEYTAGVFAALLRHVLFISFTILFVSIIKTLMKKWR